MILFKKNGSQDSCVINTITLVTNVILNIYFPDRLISHERKISETKNSVLRC